MRRHVVVEMAAACSVTALLGALLGACGASDPGEPAASVPVATTIAVAPTVAGTPAPTTSTTLAPTTTLAATTTTEADAVSTTVEVVATTAPPVTTAAPQVNLDLLLTDTGIGTLTFGTPADTTLERLSALLGLPVEDRRGEFPTPDGSGAFIDDGDVAFARPFGRFVCFANDLCLSFGGATADALIFVGWHYQHQTDQHQPPDLFTAAGLAPGEKWSDHLADITLTGGACYSVGYGAAGGISLALLSSGEFFGGYDENGQYVENTPPADQVTIMSLTAGDNEYFPFGDC